MNKPTPKPLLRSDLRLYLGQKYFILKRHLALRLRGIHFAVQESQAENILLPYTYHSHKTPLYRKLQNVDMRLQENKVVNLKLAVSKMNRVMVRPGQVFSFWKLVGRTTKQQGYVKGMVLKNGAITAATGGGLCQLSNLIYWITIHSPLTVLERHRHGYDVFPDSDRSQPFGSGATCFYNYGDLMIQNNTDFTVQLDLEVNKEYLNGRWLCDVPPCFRYEIYEKEHLIKHEFWGGYTRHNIINRRKFDIDGALMNDEFVVENHAVMMYAPFLEEKESDFLSLP